jgi:uncharacterized protein (DUF58 family)
LVTAFLLAFFGLALVDALLVAMAIPLVVYLAAALALRPRRVELQFQRRPIPQRLMDGDRLEVELEARNGPRPFSELMLVDRPPPALPVEGAAPLAGGFFPPGQHHMLRYTLRVKRGIHPWPPPLAVAYDPTGLFSATMETEPPTSLAVLPRVTLLPSITIRPMNTLAYAGPVLSRRAGEGTDFFGVRPYRPGDPLRRINWRATARALHGIVTNEFEMERIADVGIILDARQRLDIHIRGQRLFEHGVHAAACLANAFLQGGNRVALLLYGAYLEWVFPGYGKIQRERLLQALSHAQTGESLVFENLEYLPTRLFPARSQLILVSPLCGDDVEPLFRLRARGYQLLVVSPDPVRFESRLMPAHPETQLAARIARLERLLLLRRLGQAGIRVADWDVDEPLSSALLRLPPRPAPHYGAIL